MILTRWKEAVMGVLGVALVTLVLLCQTYRAERNLAQTQLDDARSVLMDLKAQQKSAEADYKQRLKEAAAAADRHARSASSILSAQPSVPSDPCKSAEDLIRSYRETSK